MNKILPSIVAASLMLHADTNSDLSTDIELLKTHITTLEKRLDASEIQAQTSSQENIENEKIKMALKSSDSFNQQSFLPDMALIINASAVSRNIKNSEFERYNIEGFTDTPATGETTEIPFNENRGFNLNYAEFSMNSTVGPFFDAEAIFHLRPTAFEIGEAFITTRQLPYNLQIKAGLFKSGFGRINAMHQHAWHFTTQPLVYEAMLGVEGLKDPGIAVKWIAPTDTYIMLGAEALQGSNELSFGDSESNNLYVTYAKSGFDINENTTALIGGSWAHGSSRDATSDKKLGTDIYGAELTLKYIIDSYSSLNFQSEYLYRDKDVDTAHEKQAGYYAQVVYGINSNWEIGARYDALVENIAIQPDDLTKSSAIVSYKPFEFSKLRLQYSNDKSKSFDGVRRDNNEIMLEFIIEAGSHGAHAF